MKKILVIEDNELNMKLFYDILTYQNYFVDKAFDGLEGFEKIKSNNYDLIILDIKLPKLDGFGLLEKIKEENIKLPKIVIASACAMDTDKLKAAQFGIDTYITKPININNFINTVKEQLNN